MYGAVASKVLHLLAYGTGEGLYLWRGVQRKSHEFICRKTHLALFLPKYFLHGLSMGGEQVVLSFLQWTPGPGPDPGTGAGTGFIPPPYGCLLSTQ